MNIQELFGQAVTDKIGKEIAEKLGIDESTSSNALKTVLPELLEKVGKNASTEEGVKNLDKALDKGHNTPDLKLDTADGMKILSHITGGDTSNLVKKLSGVSGLDTSKGNDFLGLASSFLMENLGKGKNTGLLNSSNLGSMIQMGSQVLGGKNIKSGIFSIIINFITSFLKKK